MHDSRLKVTPTAQDTDSSTSLGYWVSSSRPAYLARQITIMLVGAFVIMTIFSSLLYTIEYNLLSEHIILSSA